MDGRPAADPRWAKPRDDENEAVVLALRETFARLHSLGVTDEDVVALVSRRGRHLSLWSVRAWRETHRANTISFADVVALAGAVDEWAARPLIHCMVRAAGLEAIDLPELSPGAASVEAGALRVGVECGQLQRAVVEAAEDGQLSADELEAIGEEADDVVREAMHLSASAGGER